MKRASSYLTTDTNIIVTLPKGGQGISARTIYNMDQYYFFKDCECQEAVVTFEDSNVL